MECSKHPLLPIPGCRDCIWAALDSYQQAGMRLAEVSKGMPEEELDGIVDEFVNTKGQRLTEAMAERLGIERPLSDTEG